MTNTQAKSKPIVNVPRISIFDKRRTLAGASLLPFQPKGWKDKKGQANLSRIRINQHKGA